jgi:uncharacterized membrane protein
MASVGQPIRLPILDVARGTAVLAMILYHASWNLAHFGFIPPGSMTTPFGIWSARLIASSFLLLAGISLALAHRDGFRASAFWRRFGLIALSAALVSIVTLWTMPELPIYFGILHCIAVSSLIGVLFLRVPPLVAALAGAVILLMPLSGFRFDGGLPLIWLGLNAVPRAMADYVPLIPFSGIFLLGMAIGKLISFQSKTATAQSQPAFARGLSLLGRYSLIIYLVHQPLLFGLTSVAAGLVAPDKPMEDASFVTNCVQECIDVGGAEMRCRTLCACTYRRLSDTSPEFNALEAPLPGEANTAAIQACLKEHPN